ncbi:hypothetical protein BN1723_001572, partial [Verticillium longisporum]
MLVGVEPGKVTDVLAKSTAAWVKSQMDQEPNLTDWGVIVAEYQIDQAYRPPGQFNPNYKPEPYPEKIADMLYTDFSDSQNAPGQMMGRSIGCQDLAATGSSGFAIRVSFPDGVEKYFLTTAHHVVAKDSSPIDRNSTEPKVNAESPSQSDHDGWVQYFTDGIQQTENDPLYLLMAAKEGAGILTVGQGILANMRERIERFRTGIQSSENYNRSIGTVYRSSGDETVYNDWVRDWALVEIEPRLLQNKAILNNAPSKLVHKEMDVLRYQLPSLAKEKLHQCYLLGRTSIYNAGCINESPAMVWYTSKSGRKIQARTAIATSSRDLYTRFRTFSQDSDSGGAVLDKEYNPCGILWGGCREPCDNVESSDEGTTKRKSMFDFDGIHFVLPVKVLLDDVRSTLCMDHKSEVQVELIGAKASSIFNQSLR